MKNTLRQANYIIWLQKNLPLFNDIEASFRTRARRRRYTRQATYFIKRESCSLAKGCMQNEECETKPEIFELHLRRFLKCMIASLEESLGGTSTR